MDFSFFGDKVVEKVKQYVTKVAQSTETSTLPDPFEVAPPAVHAEVPQTEAAEVHLVKAADIKPIETVEV